MAVSIINLILVENAQKRTNETGEGKLTANMIIDILT